MNEIARQNLFDMIATYGQSVCEDTRRCEGLLRDYCADHKREVNVLVSALRERVVSDLLNSQGKLPPEIALSQLSKRLQDDLALSEEASRWAVESWMIALGILSRVEPPPLPLSRGETSRIEPPPINGLNQPPDPPPIRRLQRSTSAALHNEQVLWDSGASLFCGLFDQTGGRIKVTKERVVFVAPRFDAETALFDVPLEDISSIQGTKVPYGLSIRTKAGVEYKIGIDILKRNRLMNLLQGLCSTAH